MKLEKVSFSLAFLKHEGLVDDVKLSRNYHMYVLIRSSYASLSGCLRFRGHVAKTEEQYNLNRILWRRGQSLANQ